MRRIASVFVSSRRADKPDAPSTTSSNEETVPRRDSQKKKSRVFNSLSRKVTATALPPLPSLLASELAGSSSSSSSGSTTLRTPDDDGLPRTPSKKGNWKLWLGAKKPPQDLVEETKFPSWQSPPLPKTGLRPPNVDLSNETDADDASTQYGAESYDHDGETSFHVYSPQQIAQARSNARTMIMNSLIRHSTSPPVLQLVDAISFPRSCNNSRHLPRKETMESELHKKSLLARLNSLSRSAESSIAPLASKTLTSISETSPNFQDDFLPSADSVSLDSKGLRTWVERPCYEDRVRVWAREVSGDIICTRVPGSRFGVAALEFSERVELLAGAFEEELFPDVQFDPASEFTLPISAFNFDPPTIEFKALEPLSLPSDFSLSISEAPPAKPHPSPQPNIPPPAPPKAETVLPEVQPAKPKAVELEPDAVNDSVPRRGVRFADDDGKDDQIPLGYVLRIRKNKEQKARFLREERERRAMETHRAMGGQRTAGPQQVIGGHRAVGAQQAMGTQRAVATQPVGTQRAMGISQAARPQQPPPVPQTIREEELHRQEAERIEMDKLRRARELERKQAEERQRSAYAEELASTRARREAARMGHSRPDASPARIPDRDRSASRDSIHASLRRTTMSHKRAPELILPTSPTSPFDGSPASSLPATPGSQHSFSRPPSVYSAHTASSEDIRGRDGRRVRRSSMVQDPMKQMALQPPFNPRASFNPYAPWANMLPAQSIPPVPPLPVVPIVNGMPFYGMDMPLLPPSPPFMMNQYSNRPRSYQGSQGQQSPRQSSSSLPRTHSSEVVHYGSSGNSSHRSSGFYPSHQRRSSDEAAMAAKSNSSLGDRRSGSHTDLRTTRPPGPARPVHSQSSLHRSSWVPPPAAQQQQGPPSPGRAMAASSSSRPISTAYPHPTPTRRQTAFQ
ncbi:hypothetical protein HYDPIDRAFT_23193 [Hydnomerulius pinastri MD-312]|nr:hypothetical protein HYDPIDRAFT_23193 [Hydnomerulius pinastri MD-312]